MAAHPRSARTIPELLAGLATAVAAAIVVIALAIVPFLSPAWVAFEQGRSGAAALTGFTEPELRTAVDSILRDLVLGPPDFAVAIDGETVLAERERAHMRDVRGVFAGFALLAVASLVALVALVAGARRMGHPERAWSAIATGMRWLIVGIVVAGIGTAVAFDALFEIFHRLFFTGGSYTFDPATDRLVQLFPFSFWSETTMAVGAVVVALAAVTALVAGRRAGAARREPTPLDGSAATASVTRQSPTAG